MRDDEFQTDPLQPADDLFSPGTDQERLDQDNDVPASLPDDVAEPTIDQHPANDTGVDAHERYDAGRPFTESGVEDSGNQDDVNASSELRPIDPES